MSREYRVRPVTRYIVTEYEGPQGSRVVGTYDNADQARAVADSLMGEVRRSPDELLTVLIQYRPPVAASDPGYIGASYSVPPRPGEDWRRGGDLPDGPLNEATLARLNERLNAVIMGRTGVADGVASSYAMRTSQQGPDAG